MKREWERKKERRAREGAAFFLIYMKGPPKTNVGGREGFDRQRMYGEARRKANQEAVAVRNHKIPRSTRRERTQGKRNCSKPIDFFSFRRLQFGLF